MSKGGCSIFYRVGLEKESYTVRRPKLGFFAYKGQDRKPDT